MHVIDITVATYAPNKVACSCGYLKLTTIGNELQRLARQHARDNTPSIIHTHKKEESYTSCQFNGCETQAIGVHVSVPSGKIYKRRWCEEHKEVLDFKITPVLINNKKEVNNG